MNATPLTPTPVAAALTLSGGVPATSPALSVCTPLSDWRTRFRHETIATQ